MAHVTTAKHSVLSNYCCGAWPGVSVLHNSQLQQRSNENLLPHSDGKKHTPTWRNKVYSVVQRGRRGGRRCGRRIVQRQTKNSAALMAVASFELFLVFPLLLKRFMAQATVMSMVPVPFFCTEVITNKDVVIGEGEAGSEGDLVVCVIVLPLISHDCPDLFHPPIEVLTHNPIICNVLVEEDLIDQQDGISTMGLLVWKVHVYPRQSICSLVPLVSELAPVVLVVC